jgi:pimeloyl-ACP methyl ester carboxylesterase
LDSALRLSELLWIARRTTPVAVALACNIWPIVRPSIPVMRLHHQNLGSNNTLTADAAALIERLRLAPCHFVGLSMGGFVGMQLAAQKPDLLKTLTLLDTSADPEPSGDGPKY